MTNSGEHRRRGLCFCTSVEKVLCLIGRYCQVCTFSVRNIPVCSKIKFVGFLWYNVSKILKIRSASSALIVSSVLYASGSIYPKWVMFRVICTSPRPVQYRLTKFLKSWWKRKKFVTKVSGSSWKNVYQAHEPRVSSRKTIVPPIV